MSQECVLSTLIFNHFWPFGCLIFAQSFKVLICCSQPDVRLGLWPEPPRSPPPPWLVPHPSLQPHTVLSPGKNIGVAIAGFEDVHRLVSISQEDQVIALAEVNSGLRDGRIPNATMKWFVKTGHRHVESPSQERRASTRLCLIDVASTHRRLWLQEWQCNGLKEGRTLISSEKLSWVKSTMVNSI